MFVCFLDKTRSLNVIIYIEPNPNKDHPRAVCLETLVLMLFHSTYLDDIKAWICSQVIQMSCDSM